VKNIRKYLKRNKDVSCLWGNGEILGVKDHTDANFDYDPDDSKSPSGYVCTVNVGEVSGRSKT
jgi:hypothetical protein